MLKFSDQLKAERKRAGLTQAQLATILGVPARTLWDWEHGKTEPLQVAQEGVFARLIQLSKKP